MSSRPVIDIDISPEHRMLRESCRAFARQEIAPLVDEAEESERYPLVVRNRAGDAGLLGLSVAEEYGGAGADATYDTVAVEEFSRVCAGIATGLMPGLGLHLLPSVGTEEQCERYLRPTVAGRASGAFAITEPGAGSDVLAMRGRATRVADGWHIVASKLYITGAPFSDFMFVVVYTAPEKRRGGLSIFVVDSSTPGIEMRALRKLGHRSMETAEVFFDCVVPESALLGEENQGMKYLASALSIGRVIHSARSLGVAKAALDAVLDYAPERVTYGQPLSRHQAIQFKIARMLQAIRAAELMVIDAAKRVASGAAAAVESSLAKVAASEAAVDVATEAMQIFAGVGYMMETPIQRYFRDARLYPVSEGTTEIQLRTIARELVI